MNNLPSAFLPLAELPLVLLAAVAHPDEAFRKGLGVRLRWAFDRQGARYTSRTLRAFFSRWRGMRLSPVLRELAVLVARLAFTDPPGEFWRGLLIGPGDGTVAGGYLLKPDLEVVSLQRSGRTRLRRWLDDCLFFPELEQGRLDRFGRFLPDMARAHLDRFRCREPAVRAACQF